MATYPRLERSDGVVRWAQDLVQVLRRRDQETGGLFKLQSRVKADLPTLNIVPGTMLFVTDEAGGSVPAFFDGVNWRRMTDRAVVS